MLMVGISYFRIHLSALLARVAKGETIVITRRGKPIARVIPEPPDAKERR